jgi:hypothetical protein
MQDSNLRPSASEAESQCNDCMELDAIWDRIGTIAVRYLRALVIRSRVAHTHARELAEEVLRESRRWSMAAARHPASVARPTEDARASTGAIMPL